MEEWIEKDGWPFNPGNPKDKFPYLKFREYLIKRGHGELVEELIAWKKENEDDSAPIKTSNSKKPSIKPKRSKSHINMMKMSIRLYCPDLSMLVESKEAHIRLMSGTWAAFKFAQWPVWLALIILGAISFARQSLEARLHIQIPDHNYLVYVFINVNLLLIMFFCNQKIEKLFHYRRLSELFHIVQAAHFAHEIKEQRNKIT
jgi:hypothetical protein